MQEEPTVDSTRRDETDDALSEVTGAHEAATRIRDDATRDAFAELLRTARALKLQPRRTNLGRQTGFCFGPARYPVCRVNATKGIAFHAARVGKALIIRSREDNAFRLAAGALRRLALTLALKD